MLFNSYEFVFIFLPVVAYVFFWIGRTSQAVAALWLGVSSLFFYGWWNPGFVWLLLGSITFNYAAIVCGDYCVDRHGWRMMHVDDDSCDLIWCDAREQVIYPGRYELAKYATEATPENWTVR